MNIDALRSFVHEHPDGVRLRMIDGREFDIPHRDYASFGPPRAVGRAPGTSFVLWDEEGGFRLLNALLVSEVVPLKSNGHAGGKGGRKGKSK